MLADDVAVQQGHGTPSHFEQLHQQHVGDGGFSGSGKAGEEYGEALEMAGRVAALEFARHVWKGEPGGNLTSFVQSRSQLCSRDAEDTGAVGHFIFGKVCVLIFRITMVLNGHMGDPDLFSMSPKEFLRGLGTKKGLS